jgi:hypothetical protein
MTQYLLAVHGSAEEMAAVPPSEMEKMFKQVDEFNAEVQAAGIWVFAGGLEPAEKAVVVRNDKGNVVKTDGPFAETKEQLGGFWIIEAPDQATALTWSAKAAAACMAPVEVRPFQAM